MSSKNLMLNRMDIFWCHNRISLPPPSPMPISSVIKSIQTPLGQLQELIIKSKLDPLPSPTSEIYWRWIKNSWGPYSTKRSKSINKVWLGEWHVCFDIRTDILKGRCYRAMWLGGSRPTQQAAAAPVVGPLQTLHSTAKVVDLHM